jgi:hypothetical protein
LCDAVDGSYEEGEEKEEEELGSRHDRLLDV